MTAKEISLFEAARRAGAPLIVWKTPDPAATISAVIDAIKERPAPVVVWEVLNGAKNYTKITSGISDNTGKQEMGMPAMVSMLAAANGLFGKKVEGETIVTRGGILFLCNPHLFMDGVALQAVWNLRDAYKANGRTLILLVPQWKIPNVIASDVVVIDEELPDEPAIKEIVFREIKQSGAEVSEEDRKKAVDALTGLPAFSAEQAVSMSFEGKGPVVLNLERLWEAKRTSIEETQGLKVWRGGQTFADTAGCTNVKQFMQNLIHGEESPRGFVFIEELEKALAGVEGDTNGIMQDMLAVMLQEMEDNESEGVLFIGHGGTAKSAIAKATGNTAGVPTIKMDFGAMKGGIVGDSEGNIRNAVKVVRSVTQGRAVYVATCNKIGVIPPELQRRFTLGTFFFDLPTTEERRAIWKIYADKYGVKPTKKEIEELTEHWTGAEIKACAKRAWKFHCSISESLEYGTPIFRTRPKEVQELRQLANNAFISASEKGLYRMPTKTIPLVPTDMGKPGRQYDNN